MNKRGAELLMNVINILIVLAAVAMLSYWIIGVSTGRLAYSEVAAKQTAMLVDTALPGTSLLLKDVPDLSVRIMGNKVFGEYEKTAFAYGFFSKNKISTEKIEGGVRIKIES